MGEDLAMWIRCGKKAWQHGSALVRCGLAVSSEGRRLGLVRHGKRRLGGVGDSWGEEMKRKREEPCVEKKERERE